MAKKLLIAIIPTLLLLSCQSIPNPAHRNEEAVYTMNSESFGSVGGCKSMLDNYCDKLYSPEALGNIIIDRNKPIQILQGETPNQLPQVFLKYSQAKLANRSAFPVDFRLLLEKYNYFDKLGTYIHRMPIQSMTLPDRLNTEFHGNELGSIWSSAIDQTVVSRMSQKYSGFHRIPKRYVPVEFEVEEKRTRRKLISEISKILWKDDSNWKKVSDGFNELKLSFFALINRLDVPEDVSKSWRHKIESLNLVLPGSLPEISDLECSTTNINAYYYKYLNLITVCAGDFNSEDIILTLAHEMGHALDIDRDFYNFTYNSELGEKSNQIRELVCKPDMKMDCDKWNDYKSSLPNLLPKIANFKPELYAFNQCLKRSKTEKTLKNDDIKRIATSIIKDRVATLASSDLFLRLVKEKLPLKNGKLQKNPNFGNPCSYYLWTKNGEPIDDEIYTLIYFAAEYKCSSGNETERLKQSIDAAVDVSTRVMESSLHGQGEFSDREELVNEGLSSPPTERFADVIGTYAVAEYLKRFSSSWERRTKYLASSSWLCVEPSITTKYPEESKIEKQYSLDAHAQGEERKLEILSPPIRESLMCQRDFNFDECVLPFRK